MGKIFKILILCVFSTNIFYTGSTKVVIYIKSLEATYYRRVIEEDMKVSYDQKFEISDQVFIRKLNKIIQDSAQFKVSKAMKKLDNRVLIEIYDNDKIRKAIFLDKWGYFSLSNKIYQPDSNFVNLLEEKIENLKFK